jgi:TonB family protein
MNYRSYSFKSVNSKPIKWYNIILSVSFHLLLLFAIVASAKKIDSRKPISNYVNAQLVAYPSASLIAPPAVKAAAEKNTAIKEKTPESIPDEKKEEIIFSPEKEKTSVKKEIPKKSSAPVKNESNKADSSDKLTSTNQSARDIGGVFQNQPGMQTLDIHSIHYAWYQTIVTNILRSNWATSVADEKSINIKVIVSFYILRNGSITDVKLIEPSKIFMLDQAVLRAVLNSNPLPPLPAEFKRDKLYAQYEFVY